MNGTDEEFVPEEESEVGEDAVKRLREKLKKAVAEKQEYLDGWQRARADFANYKREEAAVHAENENRIKAELVEALIPTLDSFEMALKHDPSDDLKLVYKQLLSALKTLGVEQFGKAGEEFSPHTHEAIAKEGEGESVMRVERSGYKIANRIIRPAQVII